MVIERIRQLTRPNHEQLEMAMAPFIMRVSNITEYRRLLRFFYGYFKPVQDGIDRELDRTRLPDYGQRRRPGWIVNDLAVLGEEQPVHLPVDKNAPSIRNAAEAMGALYVLEGSSLGGKVISKMIANNLGIHNKEGLSFFNGYGAGAAEKWKDFIKAINLYSGPDEEAFVVAKADEVFAGFHQWFLVNYSQPDK